VGSLVIRLNLLVISVYIAFAHVKVYKFENYKEIYINIDNCSNWIGHEYFLLVIRVQLVVDDGCEKKNPTCHTIESLLEMLPKIN